MYKYGYVYSTIQNDFVEPLISKHGKAKSLQRRLIQAGFNETIGKNGSLLFFLYSPPSNAPIILAINIIVYLRVLILPLNPTSVQFNIIHQSLFSALVNFLSACHQPSFYITKYNVAKRFKFVLPSHQPLQSPLLRVAEWSISSCLDYTSACIHKMYIIKYRVFREKYW